MIKVRDTDRTTTNYLRGTAFDWDADGDLTVLDEENAIIAVHCRGTWQAAWNEQVEQA